MISKRNLLLLFTFMSVGTLFFIVKPAMANDLADNIEGALVMSFLNEDNIYVTANDNGRVELTGRVETLYEKNLAFELAAKTKGVNEISNQIVVEHKVVPEKKIEANIRLQLESSSSVVEWKNIDVAVTDDVVFLRGKVTYYHEKMSARDIASMQEGVRAVVNEIQVKPLEKALSDKSLENYLTTVVEEQFPMEKDLEIDVKDGNVTITGEPNSLWAAYRIEDEFSTVVGVRDIDNMTLVQ